MSGVSELLSPEKRLLHPLLAVFGLLLVVLLASSASASWNSPGNYSNISAVVNFNVSFDNRTPANISLFWSNTTLPGAELILENTTNGVAESPHTYSWDTSNLEDHTNYTFLFNVTNSSDSSDVTSHYIYNVTVDNTAPATATDVGVAPYYVGGATNYTNATPRINSTITDATSGVSKCYYSLDAGASWNSATYSGSECFATLSSQSDGKQLNISFKGGDSAGNNGTASTPFNVTVDNSTPASSLGVLSPKYSDSSGDNFSNSTPRVNASVSDSGSGVAICEYRNSSSGSWGSASLSGSECFVEFSSQSDGSSFEVYFRAIDNAGNVGSASSGLNFTVDNSTPSISNFTVNDSVVKNSSLMNFTADISDTVYLSNATLSHTNSFLLSNVSKRYNISINSSALGCSSDGSCEVNLTAVDGVGNSVTQTLSILVDNTAPVIDYSSIIFDSSDKDLFYKEGEDLNISLNYSDSSNVSLSVNWSSLEGADSFFNTSMCNASSCSYNLNYTFRNSSIVHSASNINISLSDEAGNSVVDPFSLTVFNLGVPNGFNNSSTNFSQVVNMSSADMFFETSEGSVNFSQLFDLSDLHNSSLLINLSDNLLLDNKEGNESIFFNSTWFSPLADTTSSTFNLYFKNSSYDSYTSLYYPIVRKDGSTCSVCGNFSYSYTGGTSTVYNTSLFLPFLKRVSDTVFDYSVNKFNFSNTGEVVSSGCRLDHCLNATSGSGIVLGNFSERGLELWFNLDNSSAEEKFFWTTSNKSYYLGRSSSNRAVFKIANSSSENNYVYNLSSSNNFTSGTWNHLYAEYNNSHMNLWLNGVKTSYFIGSKTIPYSTTSHLGFVNDSLIDEFIIYNSSQLLNSSEVLMHNQTNYSDLLLNGEAEFQLPIYNLEFETVGFSNYTLHPDNTAPSYNSEGIKIVRNTTEGDNVTLWANWSDESLYSDNSLSVKTYIKTPCSVDNHSDYCGEWVGFYPGSSSKSINLTSSNYSYSDKIFLDNATLYFRINASDPVGLTNSTNFSVVSGNVSPYGDPDEGGSPWSSSTFDTFTDSYKEITSRITELNPRSNFCFYNLTNSTNNTIISGYLSPNNGTNYYSHLRLNSLKLNTTSLYNGSYNFTLNCTDTYNLSGYWTAGFTVSDSTDPNISSVSASTSYNKLTISFGIDELSNYTVWHTKNNNTNVSEWSINTYSSLTTSPSLKIGGLSETTKYYYKINACDLNGNCANSTVYDATTSSEPTSSSGGGGGGGAYIEVNESETSKISRMWSRIDKGAELSFEVDKEKISLISLSSSDFLNDSIKPSLEITVLDSIPSDATTKPSTDAVNQVLEFTHHNLEEKAEYYTLEFKFSKTWLSDNSLAKEDVRVYRYQDDAWTEFSPVDLKEDSDFVYLTVKTPGLSYYVLGGKKSEEESSTSESEATSEESDNKITGKTPADYSSDSGNQTSANASTESPAPTGGGLFSSLFSTTFLIVLISLGVLVVGAGAGVYIYKKNKESEGDKKDQVQSGEDLPGVQETSKSDSSEIEESLDREIEQSGLKSSGSEETEPVQKRSGESRREESGTSTSTSLEKYVSECREKGYSDSAVKKELLKAGWPESKVDEVLGSSAKSSVESKTQATTSSVDPQLLSFIKKSRRFDHSDLEIRNRLLENGWSEEEVDEAFDQLGFD